MYVTIPPVLAYVGQFTGPKPARLNCVGAEGLRSLPPPPDQGDSSPASLPTAFGALTLPRAGWIRNEDKMQLTRPQFPSSPQPR